MLGKPTLFNKFEINPFIFLPNFNFLPTITHVLSWCVCAWAWLWNVIHPLYLTMAGVRFPLARLHPPGEPQGPKKGLAGTACKAKIRSRRKHTYMHMHRHTHTCMRVYSTWNHLWRGGWHHWIGGATRWCRRTILRGDILSPVVRGDG